jgi:hypothetical protein
VEKWKKHPKNFSKIPANWQKNDSNSSKKHENI